MNRLKDKVAFVTGSGAGIGRATAVLFASEGAKVVVASIGEPHGQETVRLITDKGGQAVYIKTDVTKPESVKKAIQETINKFRKLDIIDNNAGGSWPDLDTEVDKMSLETWEKIISFNLTSQFLCCKYGIPAIIENGRGSVIMTSSSAALVGWRRPAYTAAKGGIISLTRVLAVDYAKYNIRVNCICPGHVLTERIIAVKKKKPHSADDQRPFYLLGFGEPIDTAYAALYLASDEAKHVTGVIFPVNSGYTSVGRIVKDDLLKEDKAG